MNPLLEKRLEEFLDREDARIAKEKRDAELRWKAWVERTQQELEICRRLDEQARRAMAALPKHIEELPKQDVAPSAWACIFGGKK